MKKLTHGSLFSGIGGFELGAKWAGIETLWNCEIEPFNRDILKKHFPKTKQYEDITTLKNPCHVDIISGGFPCQDISIANGKAKGIKGQRSGLWKEMFRIIKEVKPKYVIIENSPMLTRRGLEVVLQDLAQGGYHAEWQILRARDFGFPHQRERIFVIAYADKVGREAPQMGGSRKVEEWRNPPQERLQDRKIFERTGSLELAEKTKAKVSGNTEPQFCRADDGVSKKLDRIQSLGNAVVPQIAQFIFECIKAWETEKGKHPEENEIEFLKLRVKALFLKLNKMKSSPLEGVRKSKPSDSFEELKKRAIQFTKKFKK